MTNVYDDAINDMRPAINKILNNYLGFENHNYVEQAEEPAFEINNFLKQLNIFYPDPSTSKRLLKLSIREFITKMSCFRCRVLAKDKGKIIEVWQPLLEDYKTFIDRNNNLEIDHRLNDCPYPATDIICDFVVTNIHVDISAE